MTKKRVAPPPPERFPTEGQWTAIRAIAADAVQGGLYPGTETEARLLLLRGRQLGLYPLEALERLERRPDGSITYRRQEVPRTAGGQSSGATPTAAMPPPAEGPSSAESLVTPAALDRGPGCLSSPAAPATAGSTIPARGGGPPALHRPSGIGSERGDGERAAPEVPPAPAVPRRVEVQGQVVETNGVTADQLTRIQERMATLGSAGPQRTHAYLTSRGLGRLRELDEAQGDELLTLLADALARPGRSGEPAGPEVVDDAPDDRADPVETIMADAGLSGKVPAMKRALAEMWNVGDLSELSPAELAEAVEGLRGMVQDRVVLDTVLQRARMEQRRP